MSPQTAPSLDYVEPASVAYGRLIGKTFKSTYRIDRLIARGGMGAVYEARHLRLGRRFAVKVLLEEHGSDSDLVRRFQREAQTIAQLDHPHIVQILDVDETEEGIAYFVMEYLEGRTLASRLESNGPLPVHDAIRIASDAAAALAQAHTRGIIHCDLKPANIFLVDAEGEPDFVKMLDFGVSISMDPTRFISEDRRVLGTPSYMAPEQTRDPREVDHRADQFALAAIAYEMLAGSVTFHGETPEETVRLVENVDPAPLSETAPWVPSVFDAVLQRALSKDKHRRFRSVSQFAWALENAAAEAGMDLAPSAMDRPKRRDTRGGPDDSGVAVREGDSEPPTLVEGRPAGKTQPSAGAPPPSARERAELLLTKARAAFDQQQLDDAVLHAEKLLELAVYEREARVLKVLASGLPLLDTIFEARVAAAGTHLGKGPAINTTLRFLSPRAAQLLAHIDHGMSVHDILRTSGIPRRDCIRLLAGLLRRGALA